MNGLHFLNLARKKFSFLSSHAGKENVRFRCNICGRISMVSPSKLTREDVSCRCGSTVRVRAIAHVLSLELFGESHTLPKMPFRPDLIGVDMSGAAILANRLVKQLGYTNTFIHKAPYLDILAPPEEWLSRCDFVISSDVFEHVGSPVSRAFENTLHLLKPGGVLVLTVPYSPAGETIEHFPELYRYHLEKRGDKQVLVNRMANGRVQVFDNLVFHGGDGKTLEMRVFSESGVVKDLGRAGFTDIHIHREPWSQFGITWPQEWSLPISAKRPKD
jgi:SAM-dependent methyltransferase